MSRCSVEAQLKELKKKKERGKNQKDSRTFGGLSLLCFF